LTRNVPKLDGIATCRERPKRRAGRDSL